MTNTVETVQSWIMKVVRLTGYSIPEATHVLAEFLDKGHLYTHSVGAGEGKRLFVINNNVPKEHLHQTRLIRSKGVARRLAIPTGRFGDFYAPDDMAECIGYQASTPARANKFMHELYGKIVSGMQPAKRDHNNNIWSHRENKQELILYKEFVKNSLDDLIYQPVQIEAAGRYHSTGNTRGIFGHQSGPWHLAQCDFAEPAGTDDPAERELAFDHIHNEYGVNKTNYEKILEDPLDALVNPSKYNITGKPPVAVRAALAIHEILTTGMTSFIFWTDMNASGPQLIALMTGCENLARSNGLLYTGQEQSTYTEVGKLVDVKGLPEELMPYREILITKKGVKIILVPVFYTAQPKTAMKGLLFKKGKGDDVVFLDAAELYVKGSLESLDQGIFNTKFDHMRQALGNEQAVESYLQYSKLCESAMHELSPSLRSAFGIAKEANKKGNLSWMNETGYEYFHRTVKPDMDTDEREKVEFRVDGNRHRCLMRPLVKEASGSAAATALARTTDAALITYVINTFGRLGLPIFGKHDAIGVQFGKLGLGKQTFKRGLIDYINHNKLNDINDKYHLGKPHFRTFNKSRLEKMQHHCD